MIAKLKKLLTLQIYTKEDDQRLARILLIIILAYLAVSLTLAFIYAWSQPTLSVLLLLGCLSQFIPLAFLLSGKLSASSNIIVGILIAAVTVFATLGQGIHDYTLIVFPAVLLYAGLAGGRRLGMIATGLILLALTWLVVGEANGWFVITTITIPNWMDLINVILLLLVSALAVHLLSSNLETSLARTRQELVERQRAEQRLQESESQNRAILNSVPDLLFRLNRQGVILDYRTNELDLLMAPPEVFLNQRVTEVMPEQIATNAMRLIDEVLASGKMGSFEYDLEIQGEMRHYEDRIVPLMADQVLSVVRDITERRRVETALRESEALYHAMFDNISAVKLLLNPQSGAIVRANQAAADFYGYTIERLESMNINQINTLPDERIKSEMQYTANAKSAHYHFKHRLASGELRDVEVYTGPVDLNGRRLLNSIVHDVTERNQAQAELMQAHALLENRVVERTAELRAANQALERALLARDEFLAAVSHELRTPLIGILSLSQALQLQLRPQLNEKQMVALHAIETSGQRLHELVNDVIDYSRLQSGDLNLQVIPFDLERVCRQALQGIRDDSQKKRQELVFQISPAAVQIRGDERRIKQVLANLLDNAVKFTPEQGRIELTVEGLPAEKQVRISVTDNGIGIQPENLERLFQPFTQLDRKLGRQYNGTGLGLALVQRLVSLHDGRVEVASIHGQGSTFSVYLPWEAGQE